MNFKGKGLHPIFRASPSPIHASKSSIYHLRPKNALTPIFVQIHEYIRYQRQYYCIFIANILVIAPFYSSFCAIAHLHYTIESHLNPCFIYNYRPFYNNFSTFPSRLQETEYFMHIYNFAHFTYYLPAGKAQKEEDNRSGNTHFLALLVINSNQ